MESTLAIIVVLHLKGTKITYGKFTLGTDRDTALETFNMLKGKKESLGACMIQMELIQEIAGLPVPLGTLSCNLEQLKENVAIISKEIFRIAQLDDLEIKPLQ